MTLEKTDVGGEIIKWVKGGLCKRKDSKVDTITYHGSYSPLCIP